MGTIKRLLVSSLLKFSADICAVVPSYFQVARVQGFSDNDETAYLHAGLAGLEDEGRPPSG